MLMRGKQTTIPSGAIQVQDVVLEYPVYRSVVRDRFRALLGVVMPSLMPPVRRVLDRVSFAIKPGEVVGIVGRNGAGKTSLLKVVSGLVSPTDGMVQVGGRIMALLAMGIGFRPMYTGRENLMLGGLLLGLETRVIANLISDIAQFSELGDALDQPYFTYSSGMRSRLALSLATSIPADIVILDETLAVGDLRFVAKCYQRLKEIRDSGKTVLFVSHNLGEVARLNTRVLVLESGRLTLDGDVFEGLKKYEESLAEESLTAPIISPELKDVDVSLVVRNGQGQPLKVIELGQRVSIEVTIVVQQDLGESFVFLRMMSMENNQLYAYLSLKRWETLREIPEERDSLHIAAGETTITWTLPYWICGEGSYFI